MGSQQDTFTTEFALRDRLAYAYAYARREVFDRDETPGEARRTPRQQEVLARLHTIERQLDSLRYARCPSVAFDGWQTWPVEDVRATG